MVSPSKAKKKQDTFQKQQPLGNADVDMSFQANEIEDRDKLNLIALKGSFSNPFKQPYVAPQKKLVSV